MCPCTSDRGDGSKASGPWTTLLTGLFCLLCSLLVGMENCAQAQSTGQDDGATAPPDSDSTSMQAPGVPPSRAARWRQKRRAKARSMDQGTPQAGSRPVHNLVGSVVSVIPSGLLFETPRFGAVGLHPVIENIGSDFAAGLRYELPFGRKEGRLASVEAIGGVNRYYSTEFLFGIDRASYVGYAYGSYQHRPEQELLGFGATGSHRTYEATYRMNEGIFGGLGGRSLGSNLLVGGHLSYRFSRHGQGRGDAPQIRRQFGEDLPGVGTNTDYLTVGGFFEYDSRGSNSQAAYGRRFAPTENRLRSVSLNASRGLYFSARATHNVGVGAGEQGFTRVTVDAREFLPVKQGLLRGFAFREFASFARSGGQVPFHRLQSLGGSRSLRGYSSGRFRGRGVVLLNAEMRFGLSPHLGMALFTDLGRAFSESPHLGSEGMRVGYGFGFRVRNDGKTLGRIDFGRGDGGWQMTLDLGSIF